MALHCLCRVLSPAIVLFCWLFDIIPCHSSLPENTVVSSFSGYLEVARIPYKKLIISCAGHPNLPYKNFTFALLAPKIHITCATAVNCICSYDSDFILVTNLPIGWGEGQLVLRRV